MRAVRVVVFSLLGIITPTSALLMIKSAERNQFPYIRQFAQQFGDIIRKEGQAYSKTLEFGVCKVRGNLGQKGAGGMQHPICNDVKHNKDGECTFLSYGIQGSYEWERALEKEYGCRGVGFDPSSVQFNDGQKFPGTNIEFRQLAAAHNHLPEGWKVLSPHQAANKYGMKRVSILKMDCEGCEHALVKAMKDDPSFLERVDQLSLEFHLGKKGASEKSGPTAGRESKILVNDDDLEGFEQLLKMLDVNGFKLAAMNGVGTGGVSPKGFPRYGNAEAKAMWLGDATSEIEGKWNEFCHPKLIEAGWKCGYNFANVLFARP